MSVDVTAGDVHDVLQADVDGLQSVSSEDICFIWLKNMNNK